VACLLGLALLATSAQAAPPRGDAMSAEKWDVYSRTDERGRPLVVAALRRGVAAEAALQNGFVTIVRCVADPSLVNDKGMPQGSARLYALEDRLEREPQLAAADGVRVASVTGEGARQMIYVHRSPVDLTPALSAFSVEGYTCHASAAPDRAAMIALITSTNLEQQLNADADVIASIQQQGDDGHTPRNTDFWFYGRPGALEALAGRLKVSGFSVNQWLDHRSGIVLSRKMAVNLDSFQAINPAIVAAAEQTGAEYDGWETEVLSTGGP
jgi:hypothetical protein